MPPGRRLDRGPIDRADLPEVFTPETLRGVDFPTLRRLAHRSNGVLSPDEQREFDAALRELRQDTSRRIDQSLARARLGAERGFDADLRRSFARTQARLEAQAQQARDILPEPDEDPSDDAATDAPGAVSLAVLESEIEQTSETLEILERIASIQEQQLEHQRTQLLRDTRGLFFGLLVSIAVIVAGVTPLVEAEPDDRRLIAIWTLAICATAGVVYALARAVQSKR